jgi:hypothetical protein
MGFVDTRDLPVRRPRPGFEGRFFHSAQMTFGSHIGCRAIVVDLPTSDFVGGVDIR